MSEPRAVSILDLPHVELTRALRGGAPVFLAINPVEYHGPHLPLRCDALISAGLTRELHAALAAAHPEWPLLVATPLELGVEPVPGPGSRPVPYPIVRDAVIGAVSALADLGAKRVVLMTFHGAPLHNLALEAGVRLLRRRGVQALAPLHELLAELVTLEDPRRYAEAYAGVEDEAERAALLAGLAHDYHGGYFETSLLLHYAPEAVSPVYRSLPPCAPIRPVGALSLAARLAGKVGAPRLARELAFAATGLGWYQLRPFPGYTGSPHRASPSAGAWFARELVRRFAVTARSVFDEGAPPPRPVLPWITWATLGGRLPSGTHVPRDAFRAPPEPES